MPAESSNRKRYGQRRVEPTTIFGGPEQPRLEESAMQQIDVPPGVTISSYEKGGRFVLLFAAAASHNPAADPRAIAVTLTAETLNALADYLDESE